MRNGDHKTDELIWMVPVSIQPVEPGVPKELGNHFALVVLRMPIGITDFRECLANMHERMERIKSSDEALVTLVCSVASPMRKVRWPLDLPTTSRTRRSAC